MQHTTCNSFPDGIDSCLADPNCFLPMDFTFDDSFNACYGDMYIKNSTYNPGKYVGIILCSPTRYPVGLSIYFRLKLPVKCINCRCIEP